MRKARFLAPCRADLLPILDYVTEASGSVTIAKSFVAKLRTRCHELASFETMVGRPRPELGSTFRSVPHGNYMIFFRYRDDRFEVMRIIEGHRDTRSQFGETSP